MLKPLFFAIQENWVGYPVCGETFGECGSGDDQGDPH